MCEYTIEPDENALLDDVKRKHRGNNVFIRQVEHGLNILKTTPYKHTRRISKFSGKRYRYRHGRCRIVYQVNEANKTIEISLIGLRDEGTYRNLG